jgi:hypothetical protein
MGEDVLNWHTSCFGEYKGSLAAKPVLRTLFIELKMTLTLSFKLRFTFRSRIGAALPSPSAGEAV